jgi:hypothetical protein
VEHAISIPVVMAADVFTFFTRRPPALNTTE